MKAKIALIATITTFMLIATFVTFMLFAWLSVDRNPNFRGNLDNEVDTVRELHDTDGLKQTKTLDKIAQAKCDDMVQYEYFDHVNSRGQYVWDQYPFHHSIAGENLAWGLSDAHGVVNGWNNSPTHKENMLNPKFKEVGYGVCWDKKSYFVVVQILKG